MDPFITTRDVCADLGLTEPCLRHVLRRTGAPRPPMHPTARVFLWTREDLERLKLYLAEQRGEGATMGGERSESRA
ncbi:MAG: hypothetical protein EPO68_02595 [Planctomycetota bacterium]|nr:MAG: hypothetical protein EPO68_02595 [Planctomycetota bacterium]